MISTLVPNRIFSEMPNVPFHDDNPMNLHAAQKIEDRGGRRFGVVLNDAFGHEPLDGSAP